MKRRNFLQIMTGGLVAAIIDVHPVSKVLADFVSEKTPELEISNGFTEVSGPIEIYVRPYGNDSNPGTEERPLYSLSAAIDRIPLRVTHPIIIHVAPREYEFPKLRPHIFNADVMIVGDTEEENRPVVDLGLDLHPQEWVNRDRPTLLCDDYSSLCPGGLTWTKDQYISKIFDNSENLKKLWYVNLNFLFKHHG